MINRGQPDLCWGILGAGRAALAFALDVAQTPGHRVETVAARDRQRAERLREQVAARRTSPSYQALFDDPAVDVVYIATVNSVHHQHALRALDAGKNVVVEKPLALNATQARDIAAKAEATGRFCMEGMWMRMNPLVRRALALVTEGVLGDLLGVRAELSTAHDYRPGDRLFDPVVGGGALLDLGVYPAHFAWLFLGTPDGISATRTYAASGVDDSAAMQWTYASGQFAQLFTSFLGPSAVGGVLSGTAGFAHLGPRLNRPRRLSVWVGQGQCEPVTETDDSAGNGFGPEIAEVARCIRAGATQSPLAPLADSIGVLEVLDQASRQG